MVFVFFLGLAYFTKYDGLQLDQLCWERQDASFVVVVTDVAVVPVVTTMIILSARVLRRGRAMYKM